MLKYKNIFQVIKIFTDIHWHGKKIVCTWHFYQEWDALRRPLETLPELLDNGAHRSIGKQKYECLTAWKGRLLCIVYAEYDDIIMIHIKPRRT